MRLRQNIEDCKTLAIGLSVSLRAVWSAPTTMVQTAPKASREAGPVNGLQGGCAAHASGDRGGCHGGRLAPSAAHRGRRRIRRCDRQRGPSRCPRTKTGGLLCWGNPRRGRRLRAGPSNRRHFLRQLATQAGHRHVELGSATSCAPCLAIARLSHHAKRHDPCCACMSQSGEPRIIVWFGECASVVVSPREGGAIAVGGGAVRPSGHKPNQWLCWMEGLLPHRCEIVRQTTWGTSAPTFEGRLASLAAALDPGTVLKQHSDATHTSPCLCHTRRPPAPPGISGSCFGAEVHN